MLPLARPSLRTAVLDREDAWLSFCRSWAFHVATKAGTIARYKDLLHAKKMAMLEAIAQRP
jgi:hypothetical protein